MQLYSNHCSFALARGFRHTCTSREKNNLDAAEDGYERQDAVPAAVDGAWHIALLRQILVCGVTVFDGNETLHDVFGELWRLVQHFVVGICREPTLTGWREVLLHHGEDVQGEVARQGQRELG